jgi:tetratricopeptide (TPR) repeat protein
MLPAIGGVALLALGGCVPQDDGLSMRFEAERARWHVDRREPEWGEERAREAHRGIARRFAPESPPSSVALADPDVQIRFRIAGSSALYAADLGADHGATPELADEYRGIAETYAFDDEIRVLARLGEGRMHEQLQEPVAAHSAFVRATDVAPDLFDEDRMEWLRPRLLDLEAHASRLVRHLAPGERAGAFAEARGRLRGIAQRWEGERTGWRARRRDAEVAAESGEYEAAVDSMLALVPEAVSADERADLLLAAGEIVQYRMKNFARAESLYVRSGEQGGIVRAAAEARIRLVELRVHQGRPQVALRTADEILALGARALAGRREEALYWRGRSLFDLGHWEAGLPTLEEGSQGDRGSGFALACAARRARRLRNFRRADEEEAVRALVAVAEEVPPVARIVAPEPWAFSERLDRKAFAWQESIDELRAGAATIRDPELARRARELAAEFERERLPR